MRLFQGYWWRCSRYELVRGFVRPAESAKIESYNPWEADASYEASGDFELSPHLSFADLGRRLLLEKAGDEAILKWCQKWGLLGLLPARVATVALEPRVKRRGQQDQKNEGTRLSQRILSCTAEGWKALTTAPPVDVGAIVRNPSGRWETEALEETWASYFPAVPKDERANYQYPLPNTEIFWREYAEPLSEIRGAAETHFGAFRRLAEQDPPTGEDLDLSLRRSELNDEEYSRLVQTDQWMAARSWLLDAVSEVHPSLIITKSNKIAQQWVSRSLYGAIAMMTLSELSTSRAIVCEKCLRIVPKSHSTARFCSDRCRKTAEMARYRKRRSAAQ